MKSLRAVKHRWVLWRPLSIPEEVAEWLDVEDQDLLERIKLKGVYSPVNSWPVEVGRAWSYHPFAEGSWEHDDKFVIHADRTNSVFFRDEQIASRQRERDLIRQTKELERKRKHRQWSAKERAERMRRKAAERAMEVRVEQARLELEARARETVLTNVIHGVLVNSPGNKWTIETLSVALHAEIELVRKIMHQMVREGKVREVAQ